jgi:multiple sugar transport system substrate-binding protein
LDGDAEFENVPENIAKHFEYNGNIYALPQTLHSNVLMVNEDLVEEMNVDLPEYDWTWDDFTEFIKACTNSQYSGVEDLSEKYNWMPGTMVEGRTIVGYDYETNTFDLEAVRKYVNYYQEIAKLNGVEASSLKQKVSGGKSDYTKKFGDISGADAAFISGQVASTFTGTWQYGTWNKKDLDFSWDFYPVPQCAEGRVPVHVDYCWMTTDVAEENIEAAWAFLRFVTYSKEGNIARLTTYDKDHITDNMKNVYYIPVTTDEDVVAKFESLPYVTDGILYIHENIEKGYLSDPEKTVPGFEAVEYQIIGKLAFESVTGRDNFSAKMKEAESKANAEIVKYLNQFNDALAKFEKEFANVQ